MSKYINTIKKYSPVLFLIPLLIILFSGKKYGNSLDNTFIFLPFYHEISNIVLSGEFPYRFNGVLGGMDIFNIPQFSSFYPFLFFWLPIYGNYDAALNAVTIITLLHIFLCSIGSYILFKYITKSSAIGILGGFFIGLSSTYQSLYEQLPVLLPYCWIPISTYFLIRLLDSDNKRVRIDILLLGFCAGMLILSCMNHGMIHALIIFSFILLASVLEKLSNPISAAELPQILKRLTLAFIVVLLVSGSYIFATLNNMGDSIRWLGPFGSLTGFEKMPFDAFNQDKLSFISLFNILDSTSISVAHNSILLGYAVVFFFFYNILHKPTRSVYVIFAVTIYLVLTALGDHTPIATINYHLPPFNLIRLPSTYFGAICFLVVFGAMIGLNKFIADTEGILIGMVIFLALCLSMALSQYINTEKLSGYLALIILFTSLLIKKFVNYKKANLILLAVFCSWMVQNISIDKLTQYIIPDRADFNYLEAEKVRNYFASVEGVRDYRIIISDGADKSFNRGYWANLGLWNDLKSFDVFMNPQTSAKNFFDIYYFNNQRDIDWYLNRGGKYIVCKSDCDFFIEHGYKHLIDINRYTVLSNENAKMIFGVDSESCLQSNIRRSHNGISFYFNCKNNSQFYLNEPFSKNWKASINNRSQLVRDGNGVMRVDLSAGPGLFLMKYEPVTFKYFTIINLIFMVLIPVYCIGYFAKRRLVRSSKLVEGTFTK